MMNNVAADVLTLRELADPLSEFRKEFALPEGVIYLDGNSLGALPAATANRMEQAVRQEWGNGLITSWLGADWVNAPRRIGDKIARLIGAEAGEVIACDSTSVNIFKALAAALSLRPDRNVILTETSNFPTDAYMMQGLAAFSGGAISCRQVAPEDVVSALDDEVAVLLLTQVHYKTGEVRDMAEITRIAHERGALVIWDLSHSAGAIEVDLGGAEADFAVGCGYKFLNGGPGAPAYIYVARRNQHARPVLSGWFGHASPFDFEDSYRPADGIGRFLCGTPPVLGLVALECGIDLINRADMAEIRRKSLALGSLFIELMDERCSEFGFQLASPRDPARRGSHVSFTHPNGYAIIQALKSVGVIGDFRAPDVLRFGLTPLYLSADDIVEAVERLRRVCLERSWDRSEFLQRAAVT